MGRLAASAWLLTKRILAGAVVGITISDRIGSVATMHGRSMQPTLNPAGDDPLGYLNADLIYLDKQSLLTYSFSRGDVVVFRSPLEPKMWLVKRLIALQGDWVTVPGTYEILQVPKGHCWVEGDNGEVSLDSKSFGPIPLGLMKGRVTHVIWPPNRFGRVQSQLPEGRVLSQKKWDPNILIIVTAQLCEGKSSETSWSQYVSEHWTPSGSSCMPSDKTRLQSALLTDKSTSAPS